MKKYTKIAKKWLKDTLKGSALDSLTIGYITDFASYLDSQEPEPVYKQMGFKTEQELHNYFGDSKQEPPTGQPHLVCQGCGVQTPPHKEKCPQRVEDRACKCLPCENCQLTHHCPVLDSQPEPTKEPCDHNYCNMFGGDCLKPEQVNQSKECTNAWCDNTFPHPRHKMNYQNPPTKETGDYPGKDCRCPSWCKDKKCPCHYEKENPNCWGRCVEFDYEDSPTLPEDWQEQFKKDFVWLGNLNIKYENQLKDFIRQLLAEQRKEGIAEGIELGKKSKYDYTCFHCGGNMESECEHLR